MLRLEPSISPGCRSELARYQRRDHWCCESKHLGHGAIRICHPHVAGRVRHCGIGAHAGGGSRGKSVRVHACRGIARTGHRKAGQSRGGSPANRDWSSVGNPYIAGSVQRDTRTRRCGLNATHPSDVRALDDSTEGVACREKVVSLSGARAGHRPYVVIRSPYWACATGTFDVASSARYEDPPLLPLP